MARGRVAKRMINGHTSRLSRSRGASQAASAAPTLRYGPAGDSAPRLRLSGVLGWVLLSVRLPVPLRYGVRRLFSVSYPQARRSYYLFFNYLFFNYLYIYRFMRRFFVGIYRFMRSWLTVKEKIKARPLKLDEALDIAIQTAQGLQVAHEKNVVHRDIKSANLMVTPQGQVKIMDFGLARLSDRTQLTKKDSRLGTPAYMSPEQARGEEVDRRSDIWSLGAVMYEMVTGRLPFAGEVEAAVTYSILNAKPEPLTALRTDVPIELDRIVEKALAKTADERYQHVEDLLVDLRGLRKKSQPVGPSSPVPGNRAAWYGAAAPSVIAAAAVSALWLNLSSESEITSDALAVPVPLTSYPGTEDSPTFSPDGGRVAFHWCRDGDCDIYVKLVGSETRQQLTTHPGRDLYPAWSPDGSEIAFVRGKPRRRSGRCPDTVDRRPGKNFR